MAKMNENELEDYDSLLLSHRPFPFNYPSASLRSPSDDYDEQYDYSFKDYYYDERYKYSYDGYDYDEDGFAR